MTNRHTEPETHERMFYELMWRVWDRGVPYPLPWWVQQYFRRWSDQYDDHLFDSRETAFCSNASYRYWNMIGVKDHHQESLVGQAGEVEPVYDTYSLSFFLFDKQSRELYFPQFPGATTGQPSLEQSMEDGYLPSVQTVYRPFPGVEVKANAIATVAGSDHKSVVVLDYRVHHQGFNPSPHLALCLAILPAGPTGFERRDKTGRQVGDRRISQLWLAPDRKSIRVNARPGPVFKRSPDFFGLYGNGGSYDLDHYVDHNPFVEMTTNGGLNQWGYATDYVAGLCCGVLCWNLVFLPGGQEVSLEVKLPVDDYRGDTELSELNAENGRSLATRNKEFWTRKLDHSGTQIELPPTVAHLHDLYRLCRANLLILADRGQIHPGPTIYDDFWIRDSSIEGIAAALAGDTNLAARQFGTHYPGKFNQSHERIGPASSYGFFGGHHEKNGREWDANGQALWAIGRFDRINNPTHGFGSAMYYPYVLLGARWLRDNRSVYGLLYSGWSAEHLGEREKPHYWDDLWGIAGLYEAAKLAERVEAQEVGELWDIYEALRDATVDSIRWVLDEQTRLGHWETFVPTGPADAGRLDSTMIGLLAYFHPCRLYMGHKLAPDIDHAARMTLETIWSHFIDFGGFRHDSAWNCYGPYLTLQLAHAFLLVGDLERMDHCLGWAVGNAAYSRVSRYASNEQWQVVQGAWNEQHCYPVSKDFEEFPDRAWYMGDIPHGWAAAEFMTLLRDILFFEADEDGVPHIYIAPGLQRHWLGDNEKIGIANAPTALGELFGYELVHREALGRVDIEIDPQPSSVEELVFRCPFGDSIADVELDGEQGAPPSADTVVRIPAGVQRVRITYR